VGPGRPRRGGKGVGWYSQSASMKISGVSCVGGGLTGNGMVTHVAIYFASWLLNMYSYVRTYVPIYLQCLLIERSSDSQAARSATTSAMRTWA
jgi:hypothetical protein